MITKLSPVDDLTKTFEKPIRELLTSVYPTWDSKSSNIKQQNIGASTFCDRIPLDRFRNVLFLFATLPDNNITVLACVKSY